MEKIKILLISDLHLGIEKTNPVFSGEERVKTLNKIVSIAHDHDILLIAGDLIHDENIDSKYFDILNENFLSLTNAGKEIFYTPGHGELTSQDIINEKILQLNTTFTFSDNKSSMIKSSKGNVFIYGLCNKASPDEWDIERAKEDGFHIGLFYTDFNPQINDSSDSLSVKKNNIKKMNLDFYALGKKHTFKMFKLYNKIIGAYPGSSDICEVDESGDRFVVSMEIEGSELLNIKKISVNNEKKLPPSLKDMIKDNIDDSLKGVFFQILNEKIDEHVLNEADNEMLAKIIFQKSKRNKSKGDGFAIFES